MPIERATWGNVAQADTGQGRHERVRISTRVLVVTVLIGLPALYFAAFFNRFAGLRSGAGEYAGGVLFLRGVMPYRDYFTAGPPLNTLKSALLLRCFGPLLLVSRVAGVLERLMICAMLYCWLRRLFQRTPALIASVTTIILSAADCTDPIASYNHDAIFWAVASGWFASGLFDEGRSRTRTIVLALAAGVCAGLSVLTKQTVGLASAAMVLSCVGVEIFRLRGLQRTLSVLLPLIAGCAAPIVALLVLMARLHLLRSMLTMLFVTGPSAKASHPLDFVSREFTVAWGNAGWVILGGTALALAWRPIRRAFRESSEPRQMKTSDGLGGPGRVLLFGALTIGSAEVLSLAALPALDDITKSAVYFSFLGGTGVLLLLIVRLVSDATRRSVRHANLLLLAAVSWAIAAGLSLSWPAFEAMLLPGLGLLLAALLSEVHGNGKRFAYVAVAIVVFLSVREKLDRPFLFDGQQEMPVRFATLRSTQPALRGMRLPGSTVALLDGVTTAISENTRAGDTVFTYPELGLVYALSGCLPPTFAGSHNIDVINDAMARADANRLLASPPRVLIFYRQSDAELRNAEELWRHGERSGQRDLIAAVEQLAGRYRLTGTYRLAPRDEPVEVYVRR